MNHRITNMRRVMMIMLAMFSATLASVGEDRSSTSASHSGERGKSKTARDHLAELRKRYPENESTGLAFRYRFRIFYHEYAKNHRWIFQDPGWPLYLERRVLEAEQRRTAASRKQQAKARAVSAMSWNAWPRTWKNPESYYR